MSEPCVPRSFAAADDEDDQSRGAAVELAKQLEAWAAAEGVALNPDRVEPVNGRFAVAGEVA